MKRALITVAAILATAQFAAPAQAGRPKHQQSCPGAARAITFYRAATWRWQFQRDARRLPGGHAEKSRSCAYQRWAARRWRDRAHEQRVLYVRWFRATYAKWECIHRGEGAWNASNDGYGGGLQMDATFQHSYGPEFTRRYGWASGWPVWAQLVAAERAYRSRGFQPWPNTSRACGLR